MPGHRAGPLTSLPIVFVPASQTADGDFRTSHTWFTPVWSVRAQTPADGARAIREALARGRPAAAAVRASAHDGSDGAAMARQRLLMTLVGVLAAAAILLAAIGIHGLRRALGRRAPARVRHPDGARRDAGRDGPAASRSVAWSLSLAGAVVGGLLSIPAARLVQSSLVGIGERDPVTYVAVAVSLVVVASIASVIPALRILKLDPVVALRG